MATSLNFLLTPAPIIPTSQILLPIPTATHVAIIPRVKGGSGSGSGSGSGTGSTDDDADSASGSGSKNGGSGSGSGDAASSSSRSSSLFKAFTSKKSKATCVQTCSSLQSALSSCSVTTTGLSSTTSATSSSSSGTATITSSSSGRSSSSTTTSTSAATSTDLVAQGNCVCQNPTLIKFANGEDICENECGSADEQDYEDLRESYRDLCGLNGQSKGTTLKGVVGAWVVVCAALGAAVLAQ